MSLTTRLTAFLLLALAVVLAGFSAALYFLARAYLERQTDERLTAALDTLAASAEVGRDGIEWERHERVRTIGKDRGPDQVRWIVHGDEGRVLEHSANLTGEELQPVKVKNKMDILMSRLSDSQVIEREGQRWRVRSRHLTYLGAPLNGVHFPRQTSVRENRHSGLILTAAVSLAPQEEALYNLVRALAVLSVGVLLTAALLGRWYCRRALAPVTAMATAARDMSAGDFDGRLPAPGTRDELADLAAAFNGLLGRLQEAFERQRRFTGDASHQLRTPLAAMLGQVEVGLRRERTPEDYRGVLVRVQNQAQHLRDIVEMLLFLARADAEAQLPQLEVVELSEWLTGHLQHWREHARWADFQVQAAPAPARVQPALLGQLVDNLLDNACKYSPPGTPITVRVEADADGVTLAVEDGGPGVGPEDVPHLFEPFFRSEQARRLGLAGVGLGLAVARRIATALGGMLTLDAAPGRGARFVTRLPAVVG